MWPAGVRGAQAAAGAVLLTAAALLVAAGYLAARIVEVVLLVPQRRTTASGCCRASSALAGSGSSPAAWPSPGITAGLVGGLSEGGGRGLFTHGRPRCRAGPRRRHPPARPLHQRRRRAPSLTSAMSRRGDPLEHDRTTSCSSSAARTTRCSSRASRCPASRRTTSSTAASTTCARVSMTAAPPRHIDPRLRVRCRRRVHSAWQMRSTAPACSVSTSPRAPSTKPGAASRTTASTSGCSTPCPDDARVRPLLRQRCVPPHPAGTAPRVTRRIFDLLRPGGVSGAVREQPVEPAGPAGDAAHPVRPRRADASPGVGCAGCCATPGSDTSSPPSYLFFFPRSMRQLRRVEPSLWRVPAGAQYLVIGRRP